MLHHFSFLHHANVHLRDSVFYLSCVIALIVFIVLIGALISFQKSKSNFGVEIVWAVIPFVMLFVMMIPVINMFVYQQQDTPGIMVTALLDESQST